MNTEKLSNENETEALNKHVVMQGLPTENEISRAAFEEVTPYGRQTTVNDRREYFKKGVRWAISKLSGSPTVGQRSVGTSGSAGCVHNTLNYIGPWYSCKDCGTHFNARAEAPSEGACDF